MKIPVLYEGPRGCGHREPGGTYLVGGDVMEPCALLPIELHVCPTCAQGVKPTRGFAWVAARALVEGGVDILMVEGEAPDDAWKLIEDGAFGGKGSEAHAAAGGGHELPHPDRGGARVGVRVEAALGDPARRRATRRQRRGGGPRRARRSRRSTKLPVPHARARTWTIASAERTPLGDRGRATPRQLHPRTPAARARAAGEPARAGRACSGQRHPFARATTCTSSRCSASPGRREAHGARRGRGSRASGRG